MSARELLNGGLRVDQDIDNQELVFGNTGHLPKSNFHYLYVCTDTYIYSIHHLGTHKLVYITKFSKYVTSKIVKQSTYLINLIDLEQNDIYLPTGMFMVLDRM